MTRMEMRVFCAWIGVVWMTAHWDSVRNHNLRGLRRREGLKQKTLALLIVDRALERLKAQDMTREAMGDGNDV